ncbi:MAG TPA: Gfo/Idh/MocA family oxidoreductase [Tepidisphaeraceae bacterium]|nr:Gfo/Idh/MocA family oxidoreductase [Tepidisphaeraceae bacterium]
MSKIWRCGVVGMGVIGEWHMRVLRSLPNAKFVACCDVSADRAKSVLQKNEVTDANIHTDLAKMLASEKLDVVHVCTPSGNHLEPSVTVMQAGVNVVLEKPIEITMQRIEQLIETSQKSKVRLACIFQNRWTPANRALYDAAQQGRFGRIAWAGCFTPWFRTDEYYRSGGWRGTWKLDGGGAMMNQSVHAVDLLQWIAGPVKQVSAYAAARVHKEIEVEDTLSCSLQFQSGAFGTMMGSTAMYPGGAVRIEIGGENGMAVSEDGLKMYQFRDEKPQDKQLQDKINATKVEAGGAGSQHLSTVQNHVSNIEAILAAWDQNRDAETSGPEARKAVAIILAMYESAKRNGEPVLVK